jgi:transposase-like protein
MTKKKLNTYTPEFKESAIKLALDSDESIPQIAKVGRYAPRALKSFKNDIHFSAYKSSL